MSFAQRAWLLHVDLLLLLIVMRVVDVYRLVLEPCRQLLLRLALTVMLQRLRAGVGRDDEVLVLSRGLKIFVLALAQQLSPLEFLSLGGIRLVLGFGTVQLVHGGDARLLHCTFVGLHFAI